MRNTDNISKGGIIYGMQMNVVNPLPSGVRIMKTAL